MKKIISALLIFIFTLNVSITTFAATTSRIGASKTNIACADSKNYYYSLGNGIIKEAKDGSSKNKIFSQDINYLKVLDNFIYFIQDDGIYKINTDGKELTKVVEAKPYFFIFSDGWIYYYNFIDGTINKVKPDGTYKTKIIQIIARSFCILDNRIYISNNSDNGKLYKCNLDGAGLEKLSDDTENTYEVAAYKNALYFTTISKDDINQRGLYKIYVDGTGKELVQSGTIINFDFLKDELIYNKMFDGINSMNIGNEVNKLLLSSKLVDRIGFAEGMMYLGHTSGNSYKYYKIKTDGSFKLQINPSGDAVPEEVNDVKIVVDSDTVKVSSSPLIFNGRTLLPLRDVLISLGVKNDDSHIKWNGKEKTVTVLHDKGQFKLKVDDNNAVVDNKNQVIDVPPLIYNNRTYIPLRFVSQSMGKKVFWDQDSKTAVITSSEDNSKKIKSILDDAYSKMKGTKKQRISHESVAEIKSGLSTSKFSTDEHIDFDVEKDLIYTSSVVIKPDIKATPEAEIKTEYDVYFNKVKTYIATKPDNIWQEYVYSKDDLEKEKSKVYKLCNVLKAKDFYNNGFKITEDTSEIFNLKGDVIQYDFISSIMTNELLKKYKIDKGSTEICIDKKSGLLKYFSIDAGFYDESQILTETKVKHKWTFEAYDDKVTVKTPVEFENDLKDSKLDTMLSEGIGLINEGKYDEAIKSIDKVIEKDPKFYKAYLQKGIAECNNGEYEDALKSIDVYIEAFPQDEEGYLWKANVYIDSYETDKAIEVLDKAASTLNSKGNGIYIVKGRAYQGARKYDKALEQYDKAIEINNKEEFPYVKKASVYYEQKSYSQCLDYIEKALMIFPNSYDLRLYNGYCYSAMQNSKDALKEYLEALKGYPKDDSLLAEIAKEYINIMDYQKAEEYVDRALKINSKSYTAKSYKEYIEKQKLPEAKKVADFVSENYLYFDKVTGFEDKVKAFSEKQKVAVDEVKGFIDSIREKDDKFTYFLTGKEVDMFNSLEEGKQLSSKDINDNTVLMKINLFSSKVGYEFKEAIDKIKNSKDKNLIIDLRDNGGGDIYSANDILDVLLPECVTSYTIERDGYIDTYYSDEEQVKFKKVIILVNENSASSSELVTLGLKKYLNNVVVIGKTTVGKGVGQVVYKDKDSKYVLMLVNVYWNVKEENIGVSKIVPDVVVNGSSDKDYMTEVMKRIGK